MDTVLKHAFACENANLHLKGIELTAERVVSLQCG